MDLRALYWLVSLGYPVKLIGSTQQWVTFMGLREWLVVLGLLVLAAIVLDGVRRLRRHKAQEQAEEDAYIDPEEIARQQQIAHELPHGGARPGQNPRDFTEPRLFGSKTQGTSEQQAYPNADPYPADARQYAHHPQQAHAQQYYERQDDEAAYPEEVSEYARVQAYERARYTQAYEPEYDEYAHPEYDAQYGQAPAPRHPHYAEQDTFDYSETSLYDNEVSQEEWQRLQYQQAWQEETWQEPEPPMPVPRSQQEEGFERKVVKNAQEILTINVLAPEDEEGIGFAWDEVLRIVIACGFRYSDMNIFHRYEEDETGKSYLQLSMANMFQPGTFDLEDLHQGYVSGLTFFVILPGPKRPMEALNIMYETAHCIVRNLGGELKDEQRSVLTQQTLEHYRQRVQEFERRNHLPPDAHRKAL